jgi:hypothetical protein
VERSKRRFIAFQLPQHRRPVHTLGIAEVFDGERGGVGDGGRGRGRGRGRRRRRLA